MLRLQPLTMLLLGQCLKQHDIPIYTDLHDIKEDTRVVSLLNGSLSDGLTCGMFLRIVVSDPSSFAGNVASRSTVRVAALLTSHGRS